MVWGTACGVEKQVDISETGRSGANVQWQVTQGQGGYVC